MTRTHFTAFLPLDFVFSHVELYSWRMRTKCWTAVSQKEAPHQLFKAWTCTGRKDLFWCSTKYRILRLETTHWIIVPATYFFSPAHGLDKIRERKSVCLVCKLFQTTSGDHWWKNYCSKNSKKELCFFVLMYANYKSLLLFVNFSLSFHINPLSFLW